MEASAGQGTAADRLGARWRERPVGETIYSLGALLLLASLFVPWYGQPHSAPNFFLIDLSSDDGGTAWQSLGPVPFFLAAVGAAVLAAPLVRAGGGRARGTKLETAAVSVLGLSATLLILYRILFPPGVDTFFAQTVGPIPMERSLEGGIFLALAGALGIAVGGCLSLFKAHRRPRRAAR